MYITISRNLETEKKPTQTLKYKHAYLMSQVINYYKDAKSVLITVTTFLLHYRERWGCYRSANILLSKSLHQVNVLGNVFFLFYLG